MRFERVADWQRGAIAVAARRAAPGPKAVSSPCVHCISIIDIVARKALKKTFDSQ
jgi:hypothetical protein